jgi:hypothetical protein
MPTLTDSVISDLWQAARSAYPVVIGADSRSLALAPCATQPLSFANGPLELRVRSFQTRKMPMTHVLSLLSAVTAVAGR